MREEGVTDADFDDDDVPDDDDLPFVELMKWELAGLRRQVELEEQT